METKYFTVGDRTLTLQPLHRYRHGRTDRKPVWRVRLTEISTGSAPLPRWLRIGTEYCLKTTDMSFPPLAGLGRSIHPHRRVHLDFLPYQGDHLRQGLLNDGAKELFRDLQNGSFLTNGKLYRCQVLEPLYQPFSAERFPGFEDKVRFLLQVVGALKELYLTLPGIRITAHRDLKFDNLVLDPFSPYAPPNMRLIDFDSIEFEDREKYERLTLSKHPLSPGNTAPECVLPHWAVSEKTDVFALGMMLAEIFSVVQFPVPDGQAITNPLHIFFLTDEHNPFSHHRLTYTCRPYRRLYQNLTAVGGHWLEQILALRGYPLNWERVGAQGAALQKLFCKATAFDPQERCSLYELECELQQLLSTHTALYFYDRRDLEQHAQEYMAETMIDFCKGTHRIIPVFFTTEPRTFTLYPALLCKGDVPALFAGRLQGTAVEVPPMEGVHSLRVFSKSLKGDSV